MYRNLSSLSLAIDCNSFEILSDDLSDATPTRAFSFLPGKTAGAADRLIIRKVLDIGVHSRLRSVLTSLKPSSKALVIDLTRVTYIDCASLRLLFHARHLMSLERTVAYCLDTEGQVWRMIRVLRMEEYFPIVAPGSEWNWSSGGGG